MHRIGLIGGTSWESSAHYYAQLNEGVRDQLGGNSSADLLLRSVDFSEIVALQEAGDWAGLGSRYEAEARALVSAGAQVLAILANTMHLVYDDVVRGAGHAHVVHIVDAVADRIEDMGLSTVALIGTRYTMESAELYPARLAARGITTVLPEAADAEEIHRTIYQELVLGHVHAESLRRHQDIIDRLVEAGAQAVVLGCTEQAMLLDPNDPDVAPVPLLDSTSLHVNAILEAASVAIAKEGAA